MLLLYVSKTCKDQSPKVGTNFKVKAILMIYIVVIYIWLHYQRLLSPIPSKHSVA